MANFDKFSRLAKTGVAVLGAAACGYAAFKATGAVIDFRNSMVGASSFLSWIMPIVPDGKILLDQIGLGLLGAGLGGVGTLLGIEAAGDAIDEHRRKAARAAKP